MTGEAHSELETRFADGRVLATREGAVGWLTFNRPERHNAMSVEMWEAVPLALDRLEGDGEVRVVVLRGAGGKAFISGADITQFEDRRSSTDDRSGYDRVVGAASRRIAAARRPTLAMIRGYCIGGGLGVALQCDLRIATRASSFGIPAARLGVGYGHAGLRRLIEVVGPSFATEIFATARRFTAEEALAMGLVNRVVEDSELEPFVADYCRRIAENAPLTIEAVKTCVRELARGRDFDRELCERVVRACFESEDYAEGRRAFLEKRKPVFKGK
ncbi:MAG TPA: enoyl-CoA hydratase [Thermoanaerobaculia bacterium]|nr:enoyl-CoA hydratase [Thermoanaerobaculia bacterium]